MNKIRKEFLGKRVFASPESAMRILSMWLMKKSKKVTSVNTDTPEQCVRLPKLQSQLAKMSDDDDDDDVFATSLIDQYAARPQSLNNICLATFAVNYDVQSTMISTNTIDSDSDIEESEELNTGQHENSDLNIQKYTKEWIRFHEKKKTRSSTENCKIQSTQQPRKILSLQTFVVLPMD